MSQSPFYTYFPQIALIIWGVVNLIFGLFALLGIVVAILNFSIFLRSYTHLAWAGTFLILADTFANFVIYVNQRPIYVTNCVNDASSRFENELKNAFGGISNVTLDQTSDFYNCSRLWSDELKLSILVLLLMLVIYTYWMFIIWSFSQKRLSLIQQGRVAAAIETGMPPGPIPGELVDLPPRNYGGDYEDVVVLENKKPRTRREMFSKTPAESLYNFKIDPKGHVLGLDEVNHGYLWTSDGRPASAVSARTMYSNRSQNSRRGLIGDDDDAQSQHSEFSRNELC
ncbi:unnamed protein product [Umbelopsis ramanniana]